MKPNLAIGMLWISASAFTLGSILSSNALAELPDDCMPLSEVRVGMIGEARSVVRGFELTKFEVEILGIEKGALPGSAMIIAKLKGAPLKNHGIVAGMSGSPVFIDGRIIGALAYGWAFSYEPMAGITPIEHMLTIWDKIEGPALAEAEKARARNSASSASSASSAAARGRRGDIGWNWQSDWEAYSRRLTNPRAAEPLSVELDSPLARNLTGGESMRMIPLNAPVFSSHLSPETERMLRGLFAARGQEFFMGGGGGSDPNPDTPSPPLVAGSAVGIPLMTGDTTIATSGTVTYIKGDRLLAFGHPWNNDGVIFAPMSKFRVYGYNASYQRSFRQGESRETIGAVTQDRQFGIGGLIGPQPERVPVRVRVGGSAAAIPRTYNYSIWKHRDFLPQFAALPAISESFTGSVAGGGEHTTRFSYRINLANGRTISKNMIDSSEFASTFGFSLALLRDLFLMTGNPYEEVDIESIDIELMAERGYRVDDLLGATARYNRLRPGDRLEVDLEWQPFRHENYVQRVRMDLPEDIRPGSYIVHVADSATSSRIDQRHDPGLFSPRNVEETIDLSQRMNYPTDRMRIYLFRPGSGVSVRGDSFEGIPGSIRGIVVATAPAQIRASVTGRKIQSIELDYKQPVSGRATFAIQVAPYVPE